MRVKPREESKVVWEGYTEKIYGGRLSALSATAIADLEVVQLSLEALDHAVSLLEILVESVALGNELVSQT